MTTLTQSNDSKNLTFFYGKCNGDCTDFDLTPHAEFFNSVYEFTESGYARWYKPDGMSYFTSLKCGHTYYVIINEGSNSLEIEHANIVYFETDNSSLRISDDCNSLS